MWLMNLLFVFRFLWVWFWWKIQGEPAFQLVRKLRTLWCDLIFLLVWFFLAERFYAYLLLQIVNFTLFFRVIHESFGYNEWPWNVLIASFFIILLLFIFNALALFWHSFALIKLSFFVFCLGLHFSIVKAWWYTLIYVRDFLCLFLLILTLNLHYYDIFKFILFLFSINFLLDLRG